MGVLIQLAGLAGRVFRGRGATAVAGRAAGRGTNLVRTAAGVGAGVVGGTVLGDVLGFGDDAVPRRRRRRKALTADDIRIALTIASAISKKAAENFILTRTRSA